MVNIADNRQEFWKNIDEKYFVENTNKSKAIYLRNAVAGLVKNNIASSVLELGCNSGANLLFIKKYRPDIVAVGVDINDRAIKYGKEIENNPADLQVGSIYDLSRFADKSFDLVFTCGCLMHIPHEKINGILVEMARISKLYIFNIERNGEDAVKSYAENNTPHSFTHDYVNRYKSIGLLPNKMDMHKLTNHDSKGGAEHIVWANLSDQKFLLNIKL